MKSFVLPFLSATNTPNNCPKLQLSPTVSTQSKVSGAGSLRKKHFREQHYHSISP